MLSLEKPLPRRPFLVAGALLFALKILLDRFVSGAFDRPFSLLFYFTPTGTPVLSPPSASGSHAPPGTSAYWLTIVGCALPFIVLGLTLTLRRLRDAGLPGWLALFFFVPFLKFVFFAGLAAVPTKEISRRTHTDEEGPFRSAKVDLGANVKPDSEARRHWLGVLLGVLVGDGIALAAMGISVGFFGAYGAPLMIATPAIAGFAGTFVFCRTSRPTAAGAIVVTVTTFVAGVALLGLSAMEGFGCIFLGSPLFFAETALGSFLAYSFAKSLPRVTYGSLASGVFVLPLMAAAGGVSPLPAEEAAPVESAIVVHAPPDVVWKRVVAFPPLPAPTEAIFRIGIAAPLAATIDGEGVGAIRRCEFTTGAFVEPIEVWKPGRELSFSVASQPDPMREWTLYPGPRPRHLDGYLQSTRGQFVLEPLADGSTRLIGRTWYRVHMEPVGYWRFWADRILHTIHLRVLRHVAALAEQDVRGARDAGGRP